MDVEEKQYRIIIINNQLLTRRKLRESWEKMNILSDHNEEKNWDGQVVLWGGFPEEGSYGADRTEKNGLRHIASYTPAQGC